MFISGIEERVIETAKRTARALGLEVAGHLRKPFRVIELERAITGQPQAPPMNPAEPNVEAAPSDIELRRALDCGELIQHYQPQVNLANHRVVGVEVLSRWVHPIKGMLFADKFIPHIEQHHLMEEFTWAVIQQAMKCAESFRSYEGELPTISINVSAQSLHDLTLPDRIIRESELHRIPPDKIVFEITESGLLNELPQTLDVLTRLRMKRFQLSIDDFGTGFSMMQQLQIVPATELKIDRQFVQNMESNESDRILV